ncbi:hypothetical protein U1701_06825 [Sphingomonas sp. PB2P19]|uniref:hypothetical protein n=1 Tax=Sphingomonas rhamnosi TaxID=3096156 RepID=UPI002FC8DEAB
MADNDATPMSDNDVSTATDATPAAPLKGATIGNESGKPDGGQNSGEHADGGAKPDVKQAIRENVGSYGTQAADKARMFAEDGKAKASGALDQLAQMLTDAASQVDDKLGAQYGGYARTAASSVTGFSEQVKAKDVDELIDDARELVRKSPGVAIGAAAALGFVVARLIQSGLESTTSSTPDSDANKA